MPQPTHDDMPMPVGRAIYEVLSGEVPPRPTPAKRPQLWRCASCATDDWMADDAAGVLGFCTRCLTVDYGFNEWVVS